MLSVTVMMLRDMVESVMLLKEEACRGRQVRGCEWDPSARPSLHLSSPHLTGPHLPAHTCKIHTCRAHTCPVRTYPVCLPQALFPPPALVFPDEPGGGALLRGATQPGGAQSQGLATPHIVELKGAGTRLNLGKPSPPCRQ